MSDIDSLYADLRARTHRLLIQLGYGRGVPSLATPLNVLMNIENWSEIYYAVRLQLSRKENVSEALTTTAQQILQEWEKLTKFVARFQPQAADMQRTLSITTSASAGLHTPD